MEGEDQDEDGKAFFVPPALSTLDKYLRWKSYLGLAHILFESRPKNWPNNHTDILGPELSR